MFLFLFVQFLEDKYGDCCYDELSVWGENVLVIMSSCQNVLFAIESFQTRTMKRTAVNIFGILDKKITKQKAEGFITKCFLSMFILYIFIFYIFIFYIYFIAFLTQKM